MYEQMLVQAGFGPIAGVDEAGRGACAGPLVAAAVILSTDPANHIEGLADSKQLSRTRRSSLFSVILAKALAVSWVSVQARDCDEMGLQVANLYALRQAVLDLERSPGFVISDGFSIDGLEMPNLGMWKADQVVACVSAASIIAKVIRDRILDELDEVFPGYEFAKHKGYATAAHQRLIETLGPCPQHRISYGNVARAAKVVLL